MTADHVTTRIVRSWLRTDEHESADHILAAVLAEVDTTPQRRPGWPARRLERMTSIAKLAMAAAALVVVTVVGASLLSLGPMTGVGTPSATVTPRPEHTTSTGDVQPPSGRIEPDVRHRITRGDVGLTFAVRSGEWTSDGEFWFRGHVGSRSEAWLWFYESGETPGIYTDPCAHTGSRQFDVSTAGEAEAMASLSGVEVVRAPTSTTVGGRPAMAVSIVVPKDVGCRNSQYWLTHEADCGATALCTTYPTWLGATIHFWFVELGGDRRFVVRVETRYGAEAPPDLEVELQEIVDSIRFE